MSVYSRLVSVGTTATALNSSPGSADSAAVIYNDGAVTVYVGGTDVTTSGATKGLPFAAAATISLEGQSDVLYGIVAASTCNVVVLEIGAD